MPSLMITIISTALVYFVCLLSVTTKISSQTPPYHCPNTITYTPNSIYHANLKVLLSDLSSNATTSENGFYNTTSGHNPNIVYGLFLCRGDVTTDQCNNCVTSSATKEILELCPNRSQATAWFDQCLIRYSNKNIFSMVPDTSIWSILYNTQNITDPVELSWEFLQNTMNELARSAAIDESGKKFAAKVANYTASQKLYGLVQCTPDLSPDGCNRCLKDAISRLQDCCDSKRGVRVLFASCYIRYEFYPFFNHKDTTAPNPSPVPPQPLSPPSPSPTPTATASKGKGGISPQLNIAIVVSLVVAVLLFSIAIWWIRIKATRRDNAIEEESTVGSDMITVESLQYDLRTIEAATDNFSDDNKIGEGGFGAVYKGTFSNGQEIAVKRLSKSSGQGEREFKNEVVLVAKLQHRNLVRLLGFCLERQEKILIYEFVPNKSLDYFLFDPKKGKELDWSRRYKIIGGIARGILYLHEDSRLRIIHRDLKASNILLDGDMNPKVSDFGMARIFGVDQIEGSTNRIVGTFGYMSPEYAMHGQFSVKSDVFSFGVSVLEIISGKKNSSFYQTYGVDDLLGYAWKHWRDGTPLELMDPTLENSYSRDEVSRCIHIGLLCVQEDMDARPSMPSVVHMLNSSIDTLPLPQQPPFFVRGKTNLNFPKWMESCSLNEASISELTPR